MTNAILGALTACDACKQPAVSRMNLSSYESDFAIVTIKTMKRKMICGKCIAKLLKEVLALYEPQPKERHFEQLDGGCL